MLTVKQFSAWISINGVPLETYHPQVSADGLKATGWVPSRVGQRFSLCWGDTSRTTTVSWVEIDGVHCGGILLDAGGNQDWVEMSGVQISSDLERPFMWGALTLTDDDTYLEKSPAKFGEIRLEIWTNETIGMAQKDHSTVDLDRADDIWVLTEEQKIHERTKKCLAHHVKLGEVQKTTKSASSVDSRAVEHVATFVFRYKSLDLLRADGIAPRPENEVCLPTPSTSENASLQRNAASSLSLEEYEEMKRLRARLAELESRQRHQSARVKTEDTLKIKFEQGDVIDLT